MRKHIILTFCAILGVLSIALSTQVFAQVQKPVSIPYSIDHTYPLYSFGDSTMSVTMSFTFNADGSVTVVNSAGDVITLSSLGHLVNITRDGDVVTQNFTDISVVYDFGKAGNQVKIAYRGNASKRFQFSVTGDAKRPPSIGVNEYGTDTLKYNWDDAYGTVKVSVVDRLVYFDTAGSFDIDPSVVDTTTIADLVYPNQRKVFYAAGRHWVFYTDDGDMYVNSSADGSTWLGGAKVTDLTLTTAGRFAVVYDGTHFHYCVENSGIKYRQGTPNSDGSIDWIDSEQLVENVAGTALAIGVDDDGYPWVSYYDSTNTRPKVNASSTNDGTWTDADGFPYTLAADTTRPIGVACLGGSSMYVVCSSTGADQCYGNEWDGEDWVGTESNILDANDTGFETNMACSGGQVYVAYQGSSNKGYVAIRDSGGNWGSDAELFDSNATTYPCVTALNDDGDVRLWAMDINGDDDIVYFDYIDGSWGSEQLLYEDSTIGGLYIGSGLMSSDHVSGVMYMQGGGAPYNLKYGYVVDVVAPTVVTDAATGVGSTTATLNGEITDTGGEDCSNEGFEWDIDSGAPYDYSYDDDAGSFGVGVFDHEATDLPPASTIYFRAYAINTEGTGYGDELNFETGAPEVLPEPPEDFTVTQIDATTASLSWTPGLYAINTTIRAKSGGYPINATDGWLVYDDVNATASYTLGDILPDGLYFRAWSKNDVGYSEGYASSNLGVMSMLLFAFMGFAGFMTWMCSRRRQLLLAVSTFLIWFGMAMWLFFSGGAVFDLSTDYAKIFVWVFFIMSVVPFVLYANVPILHQRYGRSWTEYGEPPQEETPDAYEQHRRLLRQRGWGRRKKKYRW